MARSRDRGARGGASHPGGRGDRSPARQEKLRLWQAIVTPLVAVGVFFGLLEGLLALVGVEPTLRSEDPFVGFAANVPLFVEETIKSLIARGSLRLVDDAWNLDAVPPGDIPASLESAVRQGIEALDPETRALISKAAVAGPSFDLTLLADVLGKDPGETQELVDRGKKNRVFDSQEGIADEDDVRFLSQCFREVVYAGLRRAERKKTHRAVGEAAERLAGDRVDQVLGTLAYHFERSDDSNKAEFYTQRVQEVSDQLFAPIDPSALGTESGLEPLDEGATEAALKFLRSLPVAIKNLRLYPAGNQLLEQSIANANATLGEALAATEAIGFTELDKSLRLNGKDIDDRATAQAKNELLQIFNDHGVRRCTFQRGITDADLYALLQILSGPAQAGTSDEHSWSDRLSQAGIEHVRIFPVIYLESEDRHPGWRREQSDRLDESHLPIVRNVLRSLTAVVDNIRLYPKESELITTTLDALEQQIDELFRENGIVIAFPQRDVHLDNLQPLQVRLMGEDPE